ncbi:hypothetical protein P3L10_024047 [Capsicum annuum]|uniref:uncharacterized protein LOC107879401 n=1 Tax=Capsicum annuum TaxID=4072 RepID=UPI0007BEF48E|nr:uncharacterized protein LOC107879401 [Capsicum annuum]
MDKFVPLPLPYYFAILLPHSHGMGVKIEEYELTCNCNYRLYNVTFETSVTRSASTVSAWINKIEIANESRLHRLIVGLDVEWRPNFNPIRIASDEKKLWEDYGLQVSNTVDLREWAPAELNEKRLLKAGLRYLGKEVAGIEIAKPKSVTVSDWDQRWLTSKQICYACLDAGRLLSAWY